LMVAMLLFLTAGCTPKALDLEQLDQAVDMEDVQMVLADIKESYSKHIDTENGGREIALCFLYEPKQRAPGKAEKVLEVSFQRGQKRTAYLLDSIMERKIKQCLLQVSIIDVRHVPSLGEQAYASLGNFGYGVLASVFFQKDDIGVLTAYRYVARRSRVTS